MEVAAWVAVLVVVMNGLLGAALVWLFVREQRRLQAAERLARHRSRETEWEQFVAGHPDWVTDRRDNPPRRRT